MDIQISSFTDDQPPLLPRGNNELTVAIASLSIGGAEKIVLDWATRIYPRWRTHMIVLRDREHEWPIPPFIKVTRLSGFPRTQEVQERGHIPNLHLHHIQLLRCLGRELAQNPNPICVCHLMTHEERAALVASGVSVVTVLHNAKEGWPESASFLAPSAQTIAVSEASAQDLAESGWEGPVSIIRHIPLMREFMQDARKKFRSAWHIPDTAFVIGMIGAVKPQKNYLSALRILKSLHKKRDAYLVIIGGPIGADARTNWKEIVDGVYAMGLRHRVAMPGFIADAAGCLPAFDVMLNTSHFEGLSIATLEALVNGMTIVASRVGGQGELASPCLILLPKDAPPDTWSHVLCHTEKVHAKPPSWSQFPSYHLWTLAGLARPIIPTEKVLFITANLNSGGAQRSLVNLAHAIKGKQEFEIAVAGNSTSSYFFQDLARAGVRVFRSADSRDAFTNAENLIQKICADHIGTVCFWNLDAKLKLLLVKALGFTRVRFVDVSPGCNAFDEMDALTEFQHLICFGQNEFYRRLDALVLKYHGPYPNECKDNTWVIPNGVLHPVRIKTDYHIHGAPRIAVNGRIAPTKFILEIIEATKRVWRKIPSAELHMFGATETIHRAYGEQVINAAGDEAGVRVFFHGPDFEAASKLPDYDACVVLGKDQGCPNASLEAMSVALPVVANNDGGTGEQIIHEHTGLLIESTSPRELALALTRILLDRDLAHFVGCMGRQHVEENFSMERMTRNYLELFIAQMPTFPR